MSNTDLVRTSGAVRLAWLQGAASLARLPADSTVAGEESIRQELKTLIAAEGQNNLGIKLSMTSIRQLRKFAAEYSEAEVRDIVDAIVEHRSPFSVSHMLVFISVPKEKRAPMLTLAVREHWSTAMILRRVKLTKPLLRAGRRRGGRRQHVPKDTHEALVKLRDLCRATLNYTDAAEERLLPILGSAVYELLSACSSTIDSTSVALGQID